MNMLALKDLVGKPGAARSILEKEYEGITDISDSDGSREEELPTFEMDCQIVKRYERLLFQEEHQLGQLFGAFDDHRDGLEACVAVEELIDTSAIDKLLTGFIIPLQEDRIKADDHRIHASLNINTETGRLSCRNPNLQNLPASTKDRYKAFLVCLLN